MAATFQQSRGSTEWEEAIGERVHATMAAVEVTRYFRLEMTSQRAQVALLQWRLFFQCRRDCCANLIAACDAVRCANAWWNMSMRGWWKMNTAPGGTTI